jgi:MinD-like ATPase involved in chromosome partitioning or flagellar assembly
MDVYPDELIIYHNETADSENSIQESLNFLSVIFDDSFDSSNKNINLQLNGNQLKVVFKKIIEPLAAPKPLPLFKNSVYQEPGVVDKTLSLLKVPVIAFHSYKGGVGRTLSLIALLQQLSRNNDFKALVVDADIEAPGLTLMAGNYGFPSGKRISYADVLSIIHDSERDALFDATLRNIAKLMINSTITIPGNDVNTDHFFFPAYRFEYQLLDNFIHPETIVSMSDRTFIIQEFLSKLGEVLNVNAIIIDLRAGLSELSAPFLFDPRVKRVFVTTTSRQSVEGTKFILENVSTSSFSRNYQTGSVNEAANMTVLLTMIPKDFDEGKKEKITIDLLETISKGTAQNETDKKDEEEDKTLSDIVIDSGFSDNLIHLDDLEQITRSLKGSSAAEAAGILSKRLIGVENSRKKKTWMFKDLYRNQIIEKIHDLVSKEVTAEGTSGVQLMATGALDKLAKAYQDTIPQLVISGAKGSGKTYIYKQLLENKYWENFTAKILSKKESCNPIRIIFPVLATANRTAWPSLLKECVGNINSKMNLKLDPSLLNENERLLIKINSGKELNPSEWFDTWNKIFLNSLSNNYSSLFELDSSLASIGKQLVFILDGLEDIFNLSISSKNNQEAIKSLCQSFVKKVSECKNIGIIIFIRSDIVKNSIQTNYEQFASQYADYALRWSQDEALRLVVWILAQIEFNDYQKDKEKIPKLTYDALIERLYPFWGRKLGKDNSNEAFSSRWILAALSDLNLQIQARDIIRFLNEVTTDHNTNDTVYHDRILLPPDIKKAIVPCSQKKLEEITMEMQDLKPIFEKLEHPGSGRQKELPIKVDEMTLEPAERQRLENQGYLQLVDKVYYIPEIIRHALGYKYASGSRPRVLSLLKQSNYRSPPHA